MARPLTKFGNLKKVMKDTKLSKEDVDSIIEKAICEFESRNPTSPVKEVE